MKIFWLDASALAKRYVNESGTSLMNHFFSRVPPFQMICLLEGIGEAISVFVRKRNVGILSPANFNIVMAALRTEVYQQTAVEKVIPESSQISSSWSLIESHSINSTDAIILRCVLDRAVELRADGFDLVLLGADERLLNAAKLGGLITFNPETDSQSDLDALIV